MSQLPGRPITIEEIRRLHAPTIADMSKKELVRTIQAGVFGAIVVAYITLGILTAFIGFSVWAYAEYKYESERAIHGR